MANTRTRYTIKFIPTIGEAGFVKSVEWDQRRFNYKNGENKVFTASERDRFYRIFPHLQFVSFKV